MGSRKHSPNLIYNDPADAAFPEVRILYAVCRRAALDLRSSNPLLQLDACLFFLSQGINPVDVLAGRVTREWLYQ